MIRRMVVSDLGTPIAYRMYRACVSVRGWNGYAARSSACRAAVPTMNWCRRSATDPVPARTRRYRSNCRNSSQARQKRAAFRRRRSRASDRSAA